MERTVTYAFGGTLGGAGIGRIAGYAVRGAHRAGLLGRVLAYDVTDTVVPPSDRWTVPFGSLLKRTPNYLLKDTLFDLATTRLVGEPELFHGWNNMCLRTLGRANRAGATTVVERASSHPTVQRRLVEREYREHGVDQSFVSDRTHRRAVAELERADAVFVPSEFVYDSFREEGVPDDKLYTIPFGVDTATFAPPANLARSGTGFTALFAGQVSIRKGIQYLLPAWEKADVDGTLRIAGEVQDAAEPIVERYRNRHDIEFLGWVDDMHREYERASVFVFPSVEEGSALVSYEAMASGLPSIVTPNVGSLVRDEREGLLVPPRAVDPLSTALERLAADPELRARFGEAARERVEDYTWERYGERVVEAYRELLD